MHLGTNWCIDKKVINLGAFMHIKTLTNYNLHVILP